MSFLSILIIDSMKLVLIAEVCKVVGGGTPKTSVSEYWSGEIVWITPKDLGKLKGFQISDSSKKISEKGLEKSSAKILPVGSVVLSSRAPIGYVGIANVPLATNQGCRSFVCNEQKIYNKYLYYFLIKNTDHL
ncbi:MAG TPA: restriction endonuclease subunit S, partial [Candidatus Paceibacterota bacterium]|nr:restriction endonuclease subunit S [Candidatus Paceibacterota bacterium]